MYLCTCYTAASDTSKVKPPVQYCCIQQLLPSHIHRPRANLHLSGTSTGHLSPSPSPGHPCLTHAIQQSILLLSHSHPRALSELSGQVAGRALRLPSNSSSDNNSHSDRTSLAASADCCQPAQPLHAAQRAWRVDDPPDCHTGSISTTQ